jgi:hypothetical protein
MHGGSATSRCLEVAKETHNRREMCSFVCEVCLLKEQRHWPLQNQTRGSRLDSLL